MRAGNPVLRREVVERWRSRRATVTLTLYLAVLGAVMYLLYRVGIAVLDSQFGFGFDPAAAGPVLGRFLVEGLLFFVLLLVLFVGPGYAAAQISGERERKTLTLLQVTLLRPVQIVLGKLGAAVAWLSLLVLAAVPLGAVAFFLGGIGIVDLLRSGLLLLVVAVSIAAIGLGISSLTRKTTGAIVLTYGMVLALVGGTLFLSGVEAVFKSSRGQQITTPVAMYFNPFFGLADAVNATRVSGMFGGNALPSPLGIIAEALPGSPAMGGLEGDVAPGVFVDEVGMGAGFDGGMAVVGPVQEPLAIPFEEGVASAEAEAVPVPDEAPPGGPPPEDAVAGAPPPPPPEEMFIEDQAQIMPEPFPAPVQEGRRPVWLIVMGIYAVMGALGVLVATRRLRVTEPRGRGGPAAPAPGAVTPPGGAAVAPAWEAPQ